MTIRVRVIRRATPSAVQVVLGNWPYRLYWLPRSHVSDGQELRAGERDIVLEISDWIAEQKGIGREVVAEDYGEMDF